MFKSTLHEKTAKHTCEAKYGRSKLLGVLNKKRYVISSQDSMEFSLGMLSAAILSELLDGIVYDSQEGCYFTNESMYKYAKTIVKEDHKNLNENGWNLHDFHGWTQ